MKNSPYFIPRGQFWGGLLRRPLTSSKRSGRLLFKVQLSLLNPAHSSSIYYCEDCAPPKWVYKV